MSCSSYFLTVPNATTSRITATDALSGVATKKYSTADNACASGTSPALTTSGSNKYFDYSIPANATTTLYLCVTDSAGRTAIPDGTSTLYLCATDNATNQTTGSFTYSKDSKTPGGSLGYGGKSSACTEGSACSTNTASTLYLNNTTDTTANKRITIATTDTQSGVASCTLQVKSATVSNGTIGTFSNWSDVVAGSKTGSDCASYTYDPTLSNGYAYQYQLIIADNTARTVATGVVVTLAIDTTPPVCNTTGWTPIQANVAWKNKSDGSAATKQTFTLASSTDTISGIATAGGSCTTTGTIHGETCSVTITDGAGNTAACASPTNNIDTKVPTISADKASSSWSNTQITGITITTSDPAAVGTAGNSGAIGQSGLATAYYRWDANTNVNATTCGGTGATAITITNATGTNTHSLSTVPPLPATTLSTCVLKIMPEIST
jgi:hypothetical protein